MPIAAPCLMAVMGILTIRIGKLKAKNAIGFG
jgi:hypothetical protein